MARLYLALGLVITVCGCSVLDRIVPGRQSAATPVPTPTPATSAPSPLALGEGRTAADLDQTSEAEKRAALATPKALSERALGSVVVSLGNPAEQGFWLRAPLVVSPGKGRVVTASGQSVAVDLLPGASGAQLSLAAFRALGLSLTDLPEVTVYAAGSWSP